MTLPQFGQLASDVRSRTAQGIIGGRVYADHNDEIDTVINRDPQAQQVDTHLITAAADSTAYTVLDCGRTIVYTSGVGATLASIAAGLAAAINDDPIAGGRVTAVSNGVSLVTVTGKWPGDSYTISDSDANITTTSVTAADLADPIGFGRAVVSVSGYGSTESYRYGRNARSTAFSAQVVTVIPTYVASAEYTVRIRDMQTGRIIADFTAVGDTSLADLLAELEAGLDGQLPANTVEVADPAGTSLTFTAELAGFEFDVEFGVGEQGASTPTFALTYTTGPSPATSFIRAFAGVSLYDSGQEPTTIGGSSASYPGNAGVMVLVKGSIWVGNTQSVAYGDPVYVELDGTGTVYGQFYNTSSATRILLPQSMARWDRYDTGDGDSLKAALHVDALNKAA